MKTPPITSPDDPRLTDKVKARFWARVQKAGPDECWMWTGTTNTRGYGVDYLGGGLSMLMHRMSLILNGQAAADAALCALHRCHVPACVNPKHLYWGTRAENAADKVAAGRALTRDDAAWLESVRKARPKGDRHWTHRLPGRLATGERHRAQTCPESIARGEQHANAKLTEVEVLEIRRLANAGAPQRRIAERFHVTQQTVSDIVRMRRWKYLAPR